jgi:CheY-like chemotaxis protein
VRVRIIRSLSGAIDGIDLSKYLEGLTYDVGTSLGNYLLAERWAVPVPNEASAAVLPLARTIRRPTVLVVEDDEDTREIMSDLLDHHGWQSIAACDGLEGLSALQRHRPSLILLDLAMPRMNGIEFRNAQRHLPDRRLASVPVVVVSAVHDAMQYKSTLDVSDVLMKPFDVDQLLHAVESYVRPINLFRW